MNKVEVKLTDELANYCAGMSLHSLAEELVKSGALKKDEKITKFSIDENGICYVIKKGAISP